MTSIPEILGWIRYRETPDARGADEFGVTFWKTEEGKFRIEQVTEDFHTKPWNDDDLASWLAGLGYCTNIERLISTPDGNVVLVTLRKNYHPALAIDGMYPTILDGLEAAVRQVADTRVR